MLPRHAFRSTLFNLCYYLLIAVSCITLLPTLILPRRFFMAVVKYFVHTTAFLERVILGLKYEIRGAENLPKDGKYIIAAKHQSAYETTKLHILFPDPAIVLKKELLKIPLWGWYLAKSDVIAIDRSTPKKAIESIKSEAKRVAAQSRPLIIFPQGTRVSPSATPQEKPYKIGIFRMQEATGLPIIPMALNSGTYYPRNAWLKKPGTVIFEFLKPIPHTPGSIPDDILNTLATNIETASLRLKQEAEQKLSARKRTHPVLAIAIAATLCFILWTGNWFMAAHLVEKSINNALNDLRENPDFTKTNISPVKITGFPGKLHLSIEEINLKTRQGSASINAITAQSWPFLGFPVTIETKEIQLLRWAWPTPLTFDKFTALLSHWDDTLTIYAADLQHQTTNAGLSGTIQNNKEQSYPLLNLNITVNNHMDFLQTLLRKNIIDKKALFVSSLALSALVQDGTLQTTLTSDNNKLYLGPLKIHEFPKTTEYRALKHKKENAQIKKSHVKRRRNAF